MICPQKVKLGGVGLYVKNLYTHNHLPSFKLSNSVSLRVENIWIEVVTNNIKYIIGGIYRQIRQLLILKILWMLY